MSFGPQSKQYHMIAHDAIQVWFGHYHLIQTNGYQDVAALVFTLDT